MGRYGSITDTRLSGLPNASADRTDTGTRARNEFSTGLFAAVHQEGTETIGDRSERNIVDGHVELLADRRHIDERDPG